MSPGIAPCPLVPGGSPATHSSFFSIDRVALGRRAARSSAPDEFAGFVPVVAPRHRAHSSPDCSSRLGGADLTVYFRRTPEPFSMMPRHPDARLHIHGALPGCGDGNAL